MKPLTLAIVIPVYNEDNYLKACLDCIAAQTAKPDEVIVVDNGSTDSSSAIAATYPFVKLIKESRSGVLYARTKGFNAVTSDIIGRIDADTLLPKNWVKQVKHIFSNPAVVAATGPAGYYDMPLEAVFRHLDYLIRLVMSRSRQFNFLWGSNMAIRTNTWKSIRGELCQTRDMYEDIDLALHLNDADYKITYRQRMRARVSARRFDSSPKSFYRYAKLYGATYRNHQRSPFMAKLATIILVAAYVFTKPLRYLYDAKAMRVKMKNIVKPHRNPPRKNPMD